MKGKKTCNNISMMDYFLLSSPVFSLMKVVDVLDFSSLSTVVCVLVYMLQWTILLHIPLIIVVSRLRMPNGFTTKKTCLSIQWLVMSITKKTCLLIQWVVMSKSLTNCNHCCLTWTTNVKAIVLKLVSMKLLTKSATFLNVLPDEFSQLKIHPVINPINLGSINRVSKSVKNFTLQNIVIVLLKIKKTVMPWKKHVTCKQEMNKSYKNHQQN